VRMPSERTQGPQDATKGSARGMHPRGWRSRGGRCAVVGEPLPGSSGRPAPCRRSTGGRRVRPSPTGGPAGAARRFDRCRGRLYGRPRLGFARPGHLSHSTNQRFADWRGCCLPLAPAGQIVHFWTIFRARPPRQRRWPAARPGGPRRPSRRSAIRGRRGQRTAGRSTENQNRLSGPGPSS